MPFESVKDFKAETHDATHRGDKSSRLHCCCDKAACAYFVTAICRTDSNWFDNWFDKSLRHVAATGCRNKSPRVTCENHFRCDRILSLRSVARIQTGLNSCDISQRQNKSKQPCRSVSADEATCHRDVSQRFVASCVSAFMHV